MRLKYLLGSIIAVPLLPLMYFQGKKIRSSVPKLPEAKEPKGKVEGKFLETKNLLLIGESTLAGVGVTTHQEGFCGTFAQELSNKLKVNLNWEVMAKSGYTAKRVRTKLIPEIKAKDLDVIVIGLGGNDAFTLNSPKQWGNDILKLIKDIRLKFPDTPIFFTNMPPIKEFPAFTKTIKFVVGNLVEILGEELEIITKKEDLVYYNTEIVSIETWTKRYNVANNVNDFFSDGVHPSKLTYQTWAKDFANFVANILKS